MNIIKKYIRYFNDEYIQKIEHNKELLIKAFIKYYGSEYEDKIRKSFDKISYFWYISSFNETIRKNISMNILDKELDKMSEIFKILGYDFNSCNIKCRLGYLNIDDNKLSINTGKIITTGNKKLDMILEKLFGEDKICSSTDDSLFNKFLIYGFSEREELIKSIFGDDVSYDEGLSKIVQIKEFITENYFYEKEQINNYLYFYIFDEYMNSKANANDKIVGSIFDSNVTSFEREKITEMIPDFINEREISCSFSATISENINAVVFNALLTSDLNFVHEVNHSVKSSLLVCKIGDKGAIHVKKSGICIYDDAALDFDILEEILNDIEASEITNIFHEFGGNLFDDDILKHHYINSNSYPKFYPLVIRFYTLYKDIIKDASISENMNILYKRVNKEKLLEYAKIIDYVYKNYLNDEIPLEFIDKANKLIDDMSIDLKSEVNIDDYIKELEESGKKVQRLN